MLNSTEESTNQGVCDAFWNATNASTREPGNLNKYIFIVTVCITGLVCIIGLSGNILSFVVFLREKKKPSTSLILQALAVSDFCILLNTLVEFSIPFIYPYTGYAGIYFRAFQTFSIYTYPLHYIFITTSTWLLVLLSIHRFIAVCKPMSKYKFEIKNTKVQVIGVYLFALAFNAPKFFDVQCVGITYCTTTTDDMCYKTILNNDLAFKLSYRIVLTNVFMYIAPITIISVLNGNLILTLKRSGENLSFWGKRKAGRDSINAILIIVVVIFMICTTPIFLSQIIMTFGEHFPKSVMEGYLYFLPILFLLVALNAAVNFFVYALVGVRFRTILRELFCGTPTGTALNPNIAKNIRTPFNPSLSLESRSSASTGPLIKDAKQGTGTDSGQPASDEPQLSSSTRSVVTTVSYTL